MHAIDLLDEALFLATRLGYVVRQESLNGSGGGRCEFGGKKWIFLDLTLSPPEQFEQVLSILADEPLPKGWRLSESLRARLMRRRAA